MREQAEQEIAVLTTVKREAAIDGPIKTMKFEEPKGSVVEWLKGAKFWPAVGRIDNAQGDRNLVCSCAPIEAYEKG